MISMKLFVSYFGSVNIISSGDYSPKISRQFGASHCPIKPLLHQFSHKFATAPPILLKMPIFHAAPQISAMAQAASKKHGDRRS